jgi:hypothetical protein
MQGNTAMITFLLDDIKVDPSEKTTKNETVTMLANPPKKRGQLHSIYFYC